MKTRILAIAGILAFMAMPATAALYQSGLPTSYDLTTEGYGTRTVTTGNPGSAFCVGCHSTNPSQYIPAAEITNTGNLTNAMLAGQYGTHFVMNTMATGVADPYGTTSPDGGGGGGMYTTDHTGDKYENLVAWTTSNGAVNSRYANTTTGATQITAGDMICESCHSVYGYMDASPLLLATYADNGDSTLCEGCHGGMHTTGNLPAFAGATTRKRHHVLDGDSVDPDTAYAAGTMWAPSYTSVLAADWCNNPYSAAGKAAASEVASFTAQLRGLCNITGTGTVAAGAEGGDINMPDATTITCANCHRPHNAMTGAGAYILRAGTGDGTTAPTQFTGPAINGTTLDGVDHGMRRQQEHGSYTGTKVYGEYIPLCVGCHQGYGT